MVKLISPDHAPAVCTRLRISSLVPVLENDGMRSSILRPIASLLAKPAITCLLNFAFGMALWFSLSQADYIMHPPPSPIFGSGNLSLEVYFLGIIFLTMVSAYFLARWWLLKQR